MYFDNNCIITKALKYETGTLYSKKYGNFLSIVDKYLHRCVNFCE